MQYQYSLRRHKTADTKKIIETIERDMALLRTDHTAEFLRYWMEHHKLILLQLNLTNKISGRIAEYKPRMSVLLIASEHHL